MEGLDSIFNIPTFPNESKSGLSYFSGIQQ
jgi:hypothetical protein